MERLETLSKHTTVRMLLDHVDGCTWPACSDRYRLFLAGYLSVRDVVNISEEFCRRGPAFLKAVKKVFLDDLAWPACTDRYILFLSDYLSLKDVKSITQEYGHGPAFIKAAQDIVYPKYWFQQVMKELQ